MAFGDLEAEPPHSLTETNFLRLFRLAQLTAEYLLHIQDRLVWETGLLKVLTFFLCWHYVSAGRWDTMACLMHCAGITPRSCLTPLRDHISFVWPGVQHWQYVCLVTCSPRSPLRGPCCASLL